MHWTTLLPDAAESAENPRGFLPASPLPAVTTHFRFLNPGEQWNTVVVSAALWHVLSRWRIAFLLCTYVALLLLMLSGRLAGLANPTPVSADEATIAQVARPVRLRIPRLQVDVPVRSVGLTPEGDMEIPAGAWETGWFGLGSKPGEKGNAVIAGHLDTVMGTPAVFSRLNELVAGDEIIVGDEHGVSRTFRVMRAETYDADAAPLGQIFGSADTAQLQLITCDGAWSDAARSYDKRLVVFTRAETDPASTAAGASGE